MLFSLSRNAVPALIPTLLVSKHSDYRSWVKKFSKQLTGPGIDWILCHKPSDLAAPAYLTPKGAAMQTVTDAQLCAWLHFSSWRIPKNEQPLCPPQLSSVCHMTQASSTQAFTYALWIARTTAEVVNAF
jgi:hypothetical protein